MKEANERAQFIFGAIATGATVYLVFRLAAGPDGARKFVMRASRASEKVCQSQAQLWAHLADTSSRVYDRARLVNA